MKKRKFSILLNISALCLCLAAIAIGVYSVKTAQLNITGTIGFEAHNCDVYVNGTLTGASTLSGTTLTPTTLYYYDTTNNNTDTTKYVNVHNDTTGWAIGDVYFDDMNNVPEGKLAQDIVITLKIYNNSKFPVYGVFDASTLGFKSSQVEVKAQKESETASEKVYIKMSANQTSADAITLIITFKLKDLSFTELELTTKAIIEFTKERPEGMPATKGDLITMDLGGTYAQGLQNTYRVLKINDDGTALVMAMFEAKKAQKYHSSTSNTIANTSGTTVQKYKDSDLDTYLNTTWYNTLNASAQNAIVACTITQYSYSEGSKKGDTHASYADYSTKALVVTITDRKVYALDVEDIEEYFGGTAGGADKNTAGTFSTTDIYTLFYNTTPEPSDSTYPWFRSANASNFYTNNTWHINGFSGYITSSSVTTSIAFARPAFKIDLSKISYSFYAG